MPITKKQQEGMRTLRIEGFNFAYIGKVFGIERNLAFYYCCVVEDQELLDKMAGLREGNRDINSSDYGIGMILKQIGAEVGMNKQKVHRYLDNVTVDPRPCLHCHTRMIPVGKFRLWCNERCHRAWKRTIKLWKERDSGKPLT